MVQSLYDQIYLKLERMPQFRFYRCVRVFLDIYDHERTKRVNLGDLNNVNPQKFVNWLQDIDLLYAFEKFLSEYNDGMSDATNRRGKLPQIVPFANRKKELDTVIDTVVSGVQRTILISAPSGFGKSALLEEIARILSEGGGRLESVHYECALVKADGTTTIAQLVEQLSTALGLPEISTEQGEQQGAGYGEIIIGKWKRRYVTELNTSDALAGLALLIDFDSVPPKTLIDTLSESFINECRDVLDDLLNAHALKIQLIIAGRALETLELTYDPTLMPLSPFTYEAVRDTAELILSGRKRRAIEQAAAHVLYLTGGHPACMARMLNDFSVSGRQAQRYFHPKKSKDLWDAQVRFVFEEFERELQVKLPGFYEIVEALSVFRFPDDEVLQRHCDIYTPRECATCDDLAGRLTRSYLYTQDVYLCDGVCRQLMIIKMRYEKPEHLRVLSVEAAATCLERIGEANEPALWALEYLFQRLQLHTLESSDNASSRAQALETYLRTEVPVVVRTLHDRQPKWKEFNGLIGLVKRNLSHQSQNTSDLGHWEFFFLFNYLFRGEEYDDSPIRALRQALDEERERYKLPTISKG